MERFNPPVWLPALFALVLASCASRPVSPVQPQGSTVSAAQPPMRTEGRYGRDVGFWGTATSSGRTYIPPTPSPLPPEIAGIPGAYEKSADADFRGKTPRGNLELRQDYGEDRPTLNQGSKP